MLTLTTPPASLAALMLDGMRAHLRVDYSNEDEHIGALLDSAVAMLDGPNGKLRRALLTQSWTATFDRFCDTLPLMLPPVQSITSVTYVDPDGDAQTLAGGAYRLVDGASWDPAVAPAHGTTWPDTIDDFDAVAVEFVTGYGDNAEDVPAAIRQAILQVVANWFDNREAVASGPSAVLPFGVGELIQPFRIYR